MSRIRIEGLAKHFVGKPPTKAVDDLNVEIEEGEFLVLLGPSGCGKTTALRCLAGLETPSAGRISFDDEVVFDADKRINRSPDKRRIGMVFQSYALWPHMTVRKNISYPLRARKIKEGLRNGWVEETAKMVDCSALLDRYPAQLSGGQQQRVALARGLVARPGLVLFDEPLSNLDARLRDHVRAELHEVHGRLGFTAVFVTHDQSEALALGDRLAIMRNGALEQYDTPQQVFEHPVSEYVAAFIGMDNRLVCEYQDGRWTVAGEPIEGDALPRGGNHPPLALRLRADDLHVTPTDSPTPAGSSSLLASVIDTEYGGRHLDVVLDANGTRLFARIPSGESGSWERSLAPGDAVRASFHGRGAHFFDEQTGIRSDATADATAGPRAKAVVS